MGASEDGVVRMEVSYSLVAYLVEAEVRDDREYGVAVERVARQLGVAEDVVEGALASAGALKRLVDKGGA